MCYSKGTDSKKVVDVHVITQLETKRNRYRLPSVAVSLFASFCRVFCCRYRLRVIRYHTKLAIIPAITDSKKDCKSMTSPPSVTRIWCGNRGDYSTEVLKTLSNHVVHFYKSYLLEFCIFGWKVSENNFWNILEIVFTMCYSKGTEISKFKGFHKKT